MLTRLRAVTAATVAAALVTLPSLALAAVSDLADLTYAGSGSKQAALVIDWNDGKSPEVIVWGYRWNGTATAADALIALAAADPRLFARVDRASSLGLALYGLGYDTDLTEGFGVTGAQDTAGNATTLTFTNGLNDLNTGASSLEAPASSEDAAPTDADDHYREGFNDNGFWELLTGPTGRSYPGQWTSSNFGLSGTTLVDGGWYALSLTESDWTSNPPGSGASATAASFAGAAYTPPDTTAPSLRVTTRIPTRTKLARLSVRGTATDAGGAVSLRIKVNRSTKTVRVSAAWKQVIRLARGKNQIEITAIDAAGNRSKPFKRRVTRG